MLCNGASIINKVRMYKIKPFSVTRSQTRQQLPTIALKTPRASQLQNNKSYFKEITKSFTGNVQYDDMDQYNLTQEQRKLKEILKKMNDDTVKIISDYTPRAKKVQHHQRTATAILAVNEREMENNQKIMSQCVMEIQILKERAAGLEVGGKELYDEQLGKIESEILHLQEQNKILRLENEKRGKSIINENRIIEEGQMRKLQTDVYLAEHRASHLRSDDFRVTEQIQGYEKKLKDMAAKFIEADKYLKEQQKKVKKLDNLKNNQYELRYKKQTLQSTKKKNEFYNQNNQYKYLNLLRQLDASNTSDKEIQAKIDKNFVSIQASKMIIGKLQTQLQQLKAKKRQRASQINQFLNKKVGSRSENRAIVRQTRQMPSQISINRDLADNSEGELEDAIAGFIDKKLNQEQEKQKKYEAVQENEKAQQKPQRLGQKLILQALNKPQQQRQDIVLSN